MRVASTAGERLLRFGTEDREHDSPERPRLERPRLGNHDQDSASGSLRRPFRRQGAPAICFQLVGHLEAAASRPGDKFRICLEVLPHDGSVNYVPGFEAACSGGHRLADLDRAESPSLLLDHSPPRA